MNNLNEAIFKGILKDIEPSHNIEDITFDKAKLLVKRDNGSEDVIDLKFKSFCNTHKENDEIIIKGNVRSYSYKVNDVKNKVNIYVFTYFDEPEDEICETNIVDIDGRICKINPLRTNKNGKHNIHFILANNLISSDSTKRLNSYIPCIGWGLTAKELSNLKVNTKLKIKGQLHSREHKKIHTNGEVELRVAHELHVKSFEVLE